MPLKSSTFLGGGGGLKIPIIFLFGPYYPKFQLHSELVMWGSASWIRGSGPAMLTFVPGNRDGVPLHFFG